MWFSVSHTNSPDTEPEVPGQRSHCLILCHFCCPMMLHQLEGGLELENTFLLAWRFEEVHLSINSGDSKEEVYGCLLRSKDLPHLRKTLTWRNIRLLNLGGRKRVQHGDRSANGEGTKKTIHKTWMLQIRVHVCWCRIKTMGVVEG